MTLRFWRCACSMPLGVLDVARGRLRFYFPGSVDRRGNLAVHCPACRAERSWRPERASLDGSSGIPTGRGTIAGELTDPATHGKTLVQKLDGTYGTVGRARQRDPGANLAARRDELDECPEGEEATK